MRGKRALIIGDAFGVPLLTDMIPPSNIAGIMVAENRPAFHASAEGLALKLGVPYFIQPVTRKTSDEKFTSTLLKAGADFGICVSYSQILPLSILEVLGDVFNVHASLLPKNRGPNPIQWALIKGEKVTGVTLHEMAEAVDAGPIIDQVSVPILENDNWVSLTDKVNAVLKLLLAKNLPQLFSGEYSSSPQFADQATVNKRLDRDYPRIDFKSMSDYDIYNLIRAQIKPLNGAFIETQNGRIYVDTMKSISEITKLRMDLQNG